VVSAPGPG